MTEGITVNSDGSWSAEGPAAVNVVRMLTIRSGIRLEATTGMKLTRGRTCSAVATDILKAEGIIAENKRPNKMTVYRLFDEYLSNFGIESKPL